MGNSFRMNICVYPKILEVFFIKKVSISFCRSAAESGTLEAKAVCVLCVHMYAHAIANVIFRLWL